MINVDPAELDKFEQLAHHWWDPNSEFKPLHDINPLRLDYIDGVVGLAGKKILDVGCGGGILAEAMTTRGARVTGIDLGEKPLKIAQLHLLESGLSVDYRRIAVEILADAEAGQYDVVTCMEMLEHVPEPANIVQSCATLVRPGGWCIFSTISRTLKAYLFAIVGAEYMFKLLPRGTHDYAKFVRPSELTRNCDDANLSTREIVGMTYNPIIRKYALCRDVSVNYMLSARKPQ